MDDRQELRVERASAEIELREIGDDLTCLIQLLNLGDGLQRVDNGTNRSADDRSSRSADFGATGKPIDQPDKSAGNGGHCRNQHTSNHWP